MDYKEALKKIQRYCAGKERCKSEIKEKLQSYELHSDEIEDILYSLQQNNYWNEERYARSYVHDKQMFNYWGPIKIRYSLYQKNVDEKLIDRALKTIQYNTFKETLQMLLEKKYRLTDYEDVFKARSKLSSYAQNKGYRYDMINNVLDEILPDYN